MVSLRSAAPAFLQTMPAPTLPWTTESAFTRLLLHDDSNKPSFYRTDIWHNLQQGQGKAFCSSSLVTMLPLFAGTSVDSKFESMTLAYREFCQEPWPYAGKRPYSLNRRAV